MKKFERFIVYPLLLLTLFYSFFLYYNLKNMYGNLNQLKSNFEKLNTEITTERLLITDDQDNILMGLDSNREGEPTFLITNGEGKRMVGIRGNKDYGSITLFNNKEDIVMELNSENGSEINLKNGKFNLFNNNNQLMANLSTDTNNNSTFRLFNNKENLIVGIGADTRHNGTIRIFSKNGQQNVGLAAVEDEFGVLRLFDNKERVSIGLDTDYDGGYMYINNPNKNTSNYYTINGMTGEISY